jgi:hypothetical protein
MRNLLVLVPINITECLQVLAKKSRMNSEGYKFTKQNSVESAFQKVKTSSAHDSAIPLLDI